MFILSMHVWFYTFLQFTYFTYNAIFTVHVTCQWLLHAVTDDSFYFTIGLHTVLYSNCLTDTCNPEYGERIKFYITHAYSFNGWWNVLLMWALTINLQIIHSGMPSLLRIWWLHFLPPPICWLRRGLVSARGLICHMEGNTFGNLNYFRT